MPGHRPARRASPVGRAWRPSSARCASRSRGSSTCAPRSRPRPARSTARCSGCRSWSLVAVAERRRYGPLPGRARRLAAIAGVFFAGDLLFWHHAIECGRGRPGDGPRQPPGDHRRASSRGWSSASGRRGRRCSAVPVVLVGVVLISGVIGAGAYGADPALGVVLGVLTALCYCGLPAGHPQRRPRPASAGRPGGHRDRRRPPSSRVGVGVDRRRPRLDARSRRACSGWPCSASPSQSIGYLCISISLPRLPAVVDLDHPARPAGRVGRPGDGPARRAAVAGAAAGRRARHRRDRRGHRAGRAVRDACASRRRGPTAGGLGSRMDDAPGRGSTFRGASAALFGS